MCCVGDERDGGSWTMVPIRWNMEEGREEEKRENLRAWGGTNGRTKESGCVSVSNDTISAFLPLETWE